MTIKEHVWDILLEAKEDKKIIYRKQILNQVNGMFTEKITDDQLRDTVREMVSEGYPIGTDPINGYYVIDSQQKFDRATESLRAKMIGLAERIKNLKRAVKDKFNIDVQLEFDIMKELN